MLIILGLVMLEQLMLNPLKINKNKWYGLTEQGQVQQTSV